MQETFTESYAERILHLISGDLGGEGAGAPLATSPQFFLSPSLQRRIQEFPEDHQSKRGTPTLAYYLTNFSRKLFENKETLTGGAPVFLS